jgi:Histidine biosynthesis protein
MMLRSGLVCLPGEDGPVPARTEAGAPLDPFDVLDRLTSEYPLIYLVDLTGIEQGEPQLDYLQELARDATIWVDAGVRNVDQTIDVLVTGAQRAVLSSSRLKGPAELRKAWKLSSELAFEIEVEGAVARAAPSWGTTDPASIARQAREAGPDHLILSPREGDPDWNLVSALAKEGPTWVDGTFARRDAGRLLTAGAAGGIFHLDEIPGLSGQAPPLPSRSDSDAPLRDDET